MTNLDEVKEESPVLTEPVVTPAPETAEEMERQFNQLPEDQRSLLIFQRNLNRFAKLMSETSLSRKHIKHLFIHAALSPMSKEEPHWSYPEQKELFEIFETIQGAKLMLMYAGIKAEEAKGPKEELSNEFRSSTEVSAGVVENAPSPVGNSDLQPGS